MINPVRQQRDLHVGRAGILAVQLKLFNRLGLRFHIQLERWMLMTGCLGVKVI
jgi:hypothetical protein